ncbi:MAG: peptidylprolyl isomerase [Deltaproteobacteria bacterium]|nr:MAG: peptidylprolyl isomerase [Deltaproteobacteria bacterium]
MAKAKEGDIVKVHYTGKLKDGNVFDSSRDGEPLELILGAGQVIPGFESAVIGMSPGEVKTFEISAEEAYGPYREELVLEIDKGRVPEDLNLEVGQQLVLRQAQGEVVRVTVTDISEETVTLDANHPLAGEDLIFEVQLVEIV